MSLHEPKAPIVRIRKKKIKKKSKDNDIVHLPVRASQQARYSTLITPPNPQTKGRECCRHLFAGCMKVPVCRLLCFRCILPPCYSGEGSDDEGGEVKDEGYHSQNRRSSEVSPHVTDGAHGVAEPEAVEMTEIRGDSGAPLIPPRNSVRVNEFRRNGVRNDGNYGQTINSGDVEDIEVNYIEVESVSLSNVEATSNNTTIPHKPLSTKSSAASSRVVGYEEPLRVNLLECKMSVGLDKKCLVQKDSSKSGMSYSECDNSDDSESNIYVNEDILKPCADSIDTKEELIVDLPENTQYINLENVIPDDLVHSTDKSSNALEKKSDQVVPGHEYINLPAPGTSECANTVSENVLRKDVILTVGPESEQKPKETASGTNDTETTQTLHQDENLKVMKKSISSLEKSMIKPEFDNSECNEDSSVVLKDKTKLIENISLPIKADDSESSDENEDGDTTTSSDQAKLL